MRLLDNDISDSINIDNEINEEEAADKVNELPRSETDLRSFSVYIEPLVTSNDCMRIQNTYYLKELMDSLKRSDPEDDFYEHFLQSIQSSLYVRSIEEPPANFYNRTRVYFPPKKDKSQKTLILDLDETLIHCISTESSDKDWDSIIEVEMPNDELLSAKIVFRPYVFEFLNFAKQHFEVAAFTASNSCYANNIIDLLDPGNDIFCYRLYREHCYKSSDGIYIKDLRIIKNRDIEEMLIVDNAPYSYGWHSHIGIPIISFFGDKTDHQLQQLEEFLREYLSSKRPDLIPQYFFADIVAKFTGENLDEIKELVSKLRIQSN